MSRTRVTRPSESVRTTMLPNWRGSISRPWVSMLSWNAPCTGTGGWLSTPDATWTFCERSAATISPGVRPRPAMRSGSSQIRMA
jgi:hypothetical protein